jgi:iron only hydrogenase large subunit-like protein
MTRPCEAACAVNAISTDEDRKSVIDYEKCVECGKCKNACPFGAISDQSSIVQVLSDIKQGKRVYALLAPAFVGQFGVMVKIGQIFNTMKQIGFHDVQEVSYAADITTIEESKEFFETVPSERPFMTTSCCPSFTALIEKHMPKMKQYVSSTASPMISMGRAIKADDPDAVTVFVGPCIAKKREARDFPGAIDHVLTFEEVTCLLVGCGLNVMSAEDTEHDSIGSKTGNLFGHAGGVALSVKELAEDLGKGDELRIEQRDGLANCKVGLLQLNAGKLDANLFEGMACEGGCIAGPGTLSNPKVADKALTTFAEKSKYKIANQNEEVNERLAKGGHWHVERK